MRQTKMLPLELVKIDGDYYVMNDSLTGSEIRFRADGNATRLSRYGSRMVEPFQTGDWIEVQLSPEGEAVLLQEARTSPMAEQALL